ncbi:hypothetical protein KY285_000893 [Solanum tuberosum]|nr:hypothetical protein KY285_000893 [Solanum tuberosum]
MSQQVDSHTTSIKKLKQQLGQLSASLNPRKKSSLPSDTIQNPKKDGHCMAITTRSGKVLNESKPVGIEQEHNIGRNKEAYVKAEYANDTGVAQPTEKQAKVKETEVEKTLPLQQIPRPPPLFLQRLKKKNEDGKFAQCI